MPAVPFNVRTWGFEPFPADERLLIRFVPSAAASTGTKTLLPLREEVVEPGTDGGGVAELVQTTNLMQDVWYEIHFEWFQSHPIQGWRKTGSSRVEAKLRVPAAGGDVAELLDAPPPPAAVLSGDGPPPDSLANALYIDRSGLKPALYAPGWVGGILKMVRVGDLEAAGDVTTAANIRQPGSETQTAVDERTTVVATQVLSTMPPVTEAAAEAVDARANELGLVRTASAARPTEVYFRGDNPSILSWLGFRLRDGGIASRTVWAIANGLHIYAGFDRPFVYPGNTVLWIDFNESGSNMFKKVEN